MKIEALCEFIYEDPNGMIESVESPSEGVVLVRYACDDWDGTDSRRLFDLECSGVREHKLWATHSWRIEWLTEHPVLWTYTSEPCYLHFTSRPSDPFAVIGRLYETHEALYQGWVDLRDLLNRSSPPAPHKLLENELGLLANGPRVVLEAYSAAIEGLLDTHMTTHPHVHYDPNGDTRALIFDEGFVVCQSVAVREVTGRASTQP